MTRLARLKMYLVKPDEPEIALKNAEQEWWDSIALRIIARSFVQATATIGIGFALGVAIMAIIGRLTGNPLHFDRFQLVLAGSMCGFFLLAAWWGRVSTQQQQMIRSKRLREAMLEDDAEHPDPKRLVPAED